MVDVSKLRTLDNTLKLWRGNIYAARFTLNSANNWLYSLIDLDDPGGNAHHGRLIGHIGDNHRSSPDYRSAANREALDDPAAKTNKRRRSDPHTARHRRAGTDMHAFLDLTFMIHQRAVIDDD